jgi:hypothetical protein
MRLSKFDLVAVAVVTGAILLLEHGNRVII